jgi:3-deoxy-D-manno-octulosonic-acid transferase
VPVVIVNGRLAPERAARYRWLSGLYRPLLAGIDAVGVAAADELSRFVALGAPERALMVTGNLKFDLPEPIESAAAIRARIGLASDRPMVAAGSTGEGEDAIVLDAFEAARRELPDLALVLAPRHPERFDSAAGEVRRRGLTVVRVSCRDVLGNADVLLVDTVGQLAALYAAASSAFVGGSLVAVGGHNLLEPLAAGVPVLFGPHTEHVAEIARTLTEAGCGLRVADADSLGRQWAFLATHPDERQRLAAVGRTVLAAHRGAMQRAADLVLRVWDGAGARRSA